MNRTHPPTYPLRPHPEEGIDWLDVLGRVAGVVVLLVVALVVVALW